MTPLPPTALLERGVARASELASTPAERRALERCAARGELLRLRRGVYGSPGLEPDILDAARVGGRVAGSSALRLHGLWVPPGAPPVLHVEVADGVDARPSAAPGRAVRVHWVRAASHPPFGFAPLDETARASGERAAAAV